MSSFHHVGGEKQGFSVEVAGEHAYLVRLHGSDQDAEAWVRGHPDYRSALAGWSTADARGERP